MGVNSYRVGIRTRESYDTPYEFRPEGNLLTTINNYRLRNQNEKVTGVSGILRPSCRQQRSHSPFGLQLPALYSLGNNALAISATETV